MLGQTTHSLSVLGQWERPGLPTTDRQAYNDIWGWVDSAGREYAIMGSLDSTYFINVSDPQNIVVCDVEAGRAQTNIHRDYKTYKNYCYGVGDEGQGSLQIFDLSYLPDSVHKVYDNDTFTYNTHNIFIADGRLYLAQNRDNGHSYKRVPMRILSLENPENPTFLFDLIAPYVDGEPMFYEVHDVLVRNDTAFCSAGDDGMYFYYYRDSMTVQNSQGGDSMIFSPNMELVGGKVRYSGNGYNHSSALTNDGKYLFFADEDSGAKLRVLSLIKGDNWKIVNQFGVKSEEGSTPHNPFVLNNLLYVSYYHEGLVVYDISDPVNPKRAAQYDTYPENMDYSGLYGCWGVYPYFPSGNIIASDQLHGLFVFSLDVGLEENDQSADQLFSVYPTMVENGVLHIEYQGEANLEQVVLSVFDVSGREVLKVRNATFNNGIFQLNVLDAKLEKGLYNTVIQHSHGMGTTKFFLSGR